MKTLSHLVGRHSLTRKEVTSSYPHTDTLSELVKKITEADLASLVATYAGTGRRSGRSTSFLCPLPQHPIRDSKRTPSFVVTTSKTGSAYWKCFGSCDTHGDALDFVEVMEGLDTGQAVKRLRSVFGLSEASTTTTPKPHKPTIKPATVKPTPPTARNIAGSKPAEAVGTKTLETYLEGRAWPFDIVNRFGLEVITYGGELWVRHPFHDYDETGTLVPVAYQDRLVEGLAERLAVEFPRWKSSTGAIGLYRIQHLETDGLEGVVLCEGASDTITASLALDGFPSWVAVGVAGAGNYRKEWNELLTGLRVVVAFDNDLAGDRGAVKVANELGRSLVRKRPTLKDLTDEAKTIGLQALGEWLTSSTTLTATPTTSRLVVPCRVCSGVAFEPFGLCGVCSSWQLYGTWRTCSGCASYSLSELGSPCHMSFGCAGKFEEVKS